jgi:O-antigen ligase
VLLLALATDDQGAYAISRWAPLTLFTLAVVAALYLSGSDRRVTHPWLRASLAGIWGLAAWSMLSMLWSGSPASAWQGSGPTIFYAAIVTLPPLLTPSVRTLRGIGWALVVGVALIALLTLVRLDANGQALFLAGRLNGPVNYRNATACLFAIGFWPFVVVGASRAYARAVRAGALAGAVLTLGLAFLTQSRGILIGLACGAAVAFLLGPERVRRAWMALLAAAFVAGGAHWLLSPYHAFAAGSVVTDADISTAASALTALTALAFVAGLLIALFDAGVRVNSPQMRYLRSGARAALAALLVAGAIAALVGTGNPASFAQSKWNEFTSLQTTTPTTVRYTNVGGQRYDLWRVALKEFSQHPLLGVGVGNYPAGYYRYRATNRNLNNPHSLAFSLLSETGIVGTALFVLFLAGMAATIGSGWRSLPYDTRRSAAALSAAGVVLLGQSMVDWMWLIPGLTAIGLFALSLAATQVAQSTSAPGTRDASRTSPVLRVAVAATLGIASLSVLALFLSDAYVQRARAEATTSPARQLAAAKTAALLDPLSVTPHYLEASAYESSDNRAQAFAQLQKALSLEPQNFASLGLLGDFEVRGGDLAAARAYYRRAAMLNPMDSGLAQLSQISSP